MYGVMGLPGDCIFLGECKYNVKCIEISTYKICCFPLCVVHTCTVYYIQFYPWFNFDSLFFFSLLIYDNECQTKENQN